MKKLSIAIIVVALLLIAVGLFTPQEYRVMASQEDSCWCCITWHNEWIPGHGWLRVCDLWEWQEPCHCDWKPKCEE